MGDESLSSRFAIAPAPDAQRLLRFSKRLPVQRCRRILGRCLDLTPAEIVHRLGIILRRDEHPQVEASGSPTPTRDAVVAALAKSRMFGEAARDGRVQLEATRPALESIRRVGHRARREVVVFGRTFALDAATVDWQRDPLTEQRLWPDAALTEASAVKATRSADGSALSDVKYVWEISRHQPLSALAFAARADAGTSDAAYVAAVLDSWIAQNPSGRGVNWASALEVGVRSIGWLWTMAALLDDAAISDATAERWLRALADHYDFLRRHLSIYTDRSNHLIGEATALWMLAAVVPGLTDADAERERALGVLATEIERQVSSDGVSREQAVGYQCFVLDFYLQVVALARRLDLALPAIIESRTTAMIEFLGALLGAGGAVPQIGDGDDGVGMPLLCVLDLRDRAESLMAIAAHVFERGDWLPDNPTARGMANLILSAGDEPTVPNPRSTTTRTSRLLRDGGYGFLEAVTADGRARQLVFDVGHLGHMPNAAHEHADALSIVVRVDRTLVLGDPGTGTYTKSAAIRNAFRGTAAHNTVTVDDLDQADVLDTFKWINLTGTQLLAWSTSADLDFVAASQDGYSRLRKPVGHVREIVFARPDYWIVVDQLTGQGTHRFTRRFHFPPEVRVTERDATTFDAVSDESGDGLRFTCFDGRASDHDGTRIEPGPWSEGYGRWGTSTRLVTETGPATSATLLALITPLRGGQAEVAVDVPDPAAQRDPQRVELCRITPPSKSTGRMDLLLKDSPNTFTFVRRDEHGERVQTLGGPRPRAS